MNVVLAVLHCEKKEQQSSSVRFEPALPVIASDRFGRCPVAPKSDWRSGQRRTIGDRRRALPDTTTSSSCDVAALPSTTPLALANVVKQFIAMSATEQREMMLTAIDTGFGYNQERAAISEIQLLLPIIGG